MKRIKQLILAVMLVFSLGLAAAPALPAYADASTSAACNAVSNNKGCTSTGPNLTSIVKIVVNVLSIVVGIVAVIMIIIGGLRYITSGGDSNNISSAKNTIIYAIIGLVIVAMAQFIVQFVLHRVK